MELKETEQLGILWFLLLTRYYSFEKFKKRRVVPTVCLGRIEMHTRFCVET
jgi:hypothetical protein